MHIHIDSVNIVLITCLLLIYLVALPILFKYSKEFYDARNNPIVKYRNCTFVLLFEALIIFGMLYIYKVVHDQYGSMWF